MTSRCEKTEHPGHRDLVRAPKERGYRAPERKKASKKKYEKKKRPGFADWFEDAFDIIEDIFD